MNGRAQQPIYVLQEGTSRETGRSAQEKNIHVARTIANVLLTTLGPRSMDKMLVDSQGDVTITNDGATILSEMDVAHPAAKMLIEVAQAQDKECGDGTKTAVILAGRLLGLAQELLDQDIHATTIAAGFRTAAAKAQETVDAMGIQVKPDDNAVLERVARTALASKVASGNSGVIAKVAIDACRAVAESVDGHVNCDIDRVQVQKASGGNIADTRMLRGIILKKERVDEGMPRSVKDAKLVLADVAFEVKKTEVKSEIEIRDPKQLQAFVTEEERYVRALVDQITALGATVLFSQKAIGDLAKHHLARAGVYAVERVGREEVEKLEKATGATCVSTLTDLDHSVLGHAGHVYQDRLGDERYTFVVECKDPKAVCVLLRGGTDHLLDEMERALHDTLSVVALAIQDSKVLPGGGAAFMEVAKALRDLAPTVGGRQQLAVEAFAEAVETIPRMLAANAGFDEIDVLIALRQAHAKDGRNFGVSVKSRGAGDMLKDDVVEPVRVVRQSLASATEAAIMILRIDDVIASKQAPAGGGGAGG